MRLAITALIAALLCAGAAQAADPEPPAEPAPLERRMDVWEYRVDGNRVLDAQDIEAALTPYLGPQRSVQDIQDARSALEKAYRSKGYETVAVDIPEQDVRGGIVRFAVTELEIGRLRVTGSRYYSPERIKAGVPSLAEGAVPRYDLVAKDIGRINQSRDRTVTPTLRAGAAPNTVDVDLEVEDRLPVHGSLELNDRRSTRTSRLRAVASVSYSNLFQREHNLSLQAQTSPQEPEETQLFSASYLAPFRGTNFSLVAYGVRSESEVAAVGGINVLGSGTIVGARGVWTFAGERSAQTLIAGIDYKDFKENLVVVGADSAATPISYLPLTFEYSLNQFGESATSEFGAAINAGTRGLASDDAEFNGKRADARANYLFARLTASRSQQLPADFRIVAALSGQIANGPLISNEGFSIGGLDSVRGYLESQEVGDHGARASLQLESPSLAKHLGDWMQELRIFGFGDWGSVWIDDPLPDFTTGRTVERITLYSVGFGFRTQLLTHLHGMLAIAAPLKNEDELNLDIDDEYRLHLSVKGEF